MNKPCDVIGTTNLIQFKLVVLNLFTFLYHLVVSYYQSVSFQAEQQTRSFVTFVESSILGVRVKSKFVSFCFRNHHES